MCKSVSPYKLNFHNVLSLVYFFAKIAILTLTVSAHNSQSKFDFIVHSGSTVCRNPLSLDRRQCDKIWRSFAT